MRRPGSSQYFHIYRHVSVAEMRRLLIDGPMDPLADLVLSFRG